MPITPSMRHRVLVVVLLSVAASALMATSHAPVHAGLLPVLTPKPTPVPSPTTTPTASPPPVGADLGGCQAFPADNVWRQDISDAPVDPNSDNYMNAVTAGGTGMLHTDFGSNNTYGIPYIVVPSTQPKVKIRYIAFGAQSDPGPFPIPLTAPVEKAPDHHVLAVQQGTCKIYELFAASPRLDHWNAESGAVFDLNSDALRPAGWTSADAAGLPILPALVRMNEIGEGVINHALRFTAPQTQHGYVFPARHYASTSYDPNLPPMGLRLRLKASFDLTPYHGQALIILEALKKYGMLLADNGSSLSITGATEPGWNDSDLYQLHSVPDDAFEVVEHGPITTQ
jgi:hypothetical protein